MHTEGAVYTKQLKFVAVDYCVASCSLQTGPHTLDVPGMPCLPHLHDQVLLFAIIGTGILLGQFSCSKTLGDARLQTVATVLPRAAALGATPPGGLDSPARHFDQDSVTYCALRQRLRL